MNEPSPHTTKPLAPRRLLVTGGAGFIGSHLVERLVARGDDVTIVDDLSTGRESNIAAVIDRVRFLKRGLAEAMPALGDEHFDGIYHLAAAVGVKLVLEKPIESIETNVDLTAALLRFAAKRGPDGSPCPTLIASSSEVYGKPDHEVFSEDDDAVYGPTTITRWSYALSKALDEHLALAHHAAGTVPVVVVRFFNTVGPRQIGRYGMVLPRFVAAALAGDDLEVYGDGSQSRCFCDVRDSASALPKLLDDPGCHGRVFNLGSDSPIRIGDLARDVVRLTESTSSIRHVPYDDAYPAGFEDLKHRRPGLTRVRDAIGFEASTPLDQTILDLADEIRGGSVDSIATRPAAQTGEQP
ncbi:MAG: NAD-dependent epimerase/dehydratase family protein [Planctomycetota bacterium]